MKISGQDLLVNDGLAWEGDLATFYFTRARVENVAVWHVTIMSQRTASVAFHVSSASLMGKGYCWA